jgi:CHAT domain-containing protein
MRSLFVLVIVFLLLVGCDRPQASDYFGGASGRGVEGVNLGQSSSGETCSQLPGDAPDTVAVFCGTWQQPSARIHADGASGAAKPMGVATSGPWRDTINLRFACDTPVATTILGDAQAAAMQCRRRIGGWPQVALVAAVDGRLYEADGILPTLAVIERSIGVQSGRLSASSVALLPSAADSLLASQLAARVFGAGDVGEYQRLMAVGARANLAEGFAAAETAYRAAFALQQKVLGRDDPDTVTALMHLALQVSDQGRFAEADTLFRQAAKLAPLASDKAAVARLRHYEGLHALNQGRKEQALALLTEAETAYAALVPRESLQNVPLAPSVQLTSTGEIAPLPSNQLMIDPTAQSALIGLIEVRRYSAIVLRQLGRAAESEAAIGSAQALARANQMGVPLVSARLTRTNATIDDIRGDVVSADSGFFASRQNFTQVVPSTRPVAETALLQAAVAAKQGNMARAIELCRAGAALLRELRSGVEPVLLEPCLASFAAEAERDPRGRQVLLAQMFETAELAQDNMTSRQIDEAAARLAANTRDPKVAEAIRRRQDADDKLSELYRQRDALAADAPPGSMRPGSLTNLAELDRQIADAQAELADADGALQIASPNFGQLVQQVVPAADVLAALGPDEALAAITLTTHGGWSFLLRGGAIDVSPIKGDAASITALVKRLRASIETPSFDTAAAQSLYDATLAPIGARLGGAKALVVAPSGALLALPFGLLLTGPAQHDDLPHAPWLIRQMTVVHVPAAANFVALRRAGSSRAIKPWFGFGGFRPPSIAQAAATFGPACANSARLFASLPPLPFAQRELDAARAILGASSSDELLSTAFTVDAVRQADLKNYRILHFATHALLPAELRCQNEPAIITSAPPNARDVSGMLLSASSIMGLDLDANTVILSACNTGGPGDSTGGESLSGLARAFFYAGARALVVTHWPINDQSSTFLITDTLRRFISGSDGGMAGALRAAQLGLLDKAGKELPAQLALPYFWAPFALVGEGSALATRTAMR